MIPERAMIEWREFVPWIRVHYFHTTVNPQIGVKFWKLWLKTGPSMHLYRSDPAARSFGKTGGMYYNFEIFIKL